MDLVSVIIPVYNSERYISKSLESVLNQTYSNIEIIIIDDGSTDSSCDICRKYADLNENIKLIAKKNEGVSQARNVGINVSSGKWIMFLDSDDYIEKDTIKNAMNLVTRDNCDTICWNYKKMIDHKLINCKRINEITLNNKESLNSIIYSIIESSYYEKNYYGDFIRAPWAKILNMKIIKENNIKFDPKLNIGEDAMFLIEYFTYARKVKFINNYNNIYRITPTSTVGKYKNDLDKQIIIQLKKIKYLIEIIEEIDSKKLNIVISKFYLNSIYELIYNYNFKGNKQHCFNLRKFIEETQINMKEIKFKFLSKRQILIYSLIKFNKIRLLELIIKMKVEVIDNQRSKK